MAATAASTAAFTAPAVVQSTSETLSGPPLTMVPDGAFWALSPSTGTAHLEADVRRLSNGYVYRVSKDVPFVIDGTVDILPDGTASILVGSPDLR